MVRAPFEPKSKKAMPLLNCMVNASLKADVPRYVTGRIVAQFFEEVTHQVSEGHVVRIPGFGAFGQCVRPPVADEVLPAALPRFCAAHGWRRMVTETPRKVAPPIRHRPVRIDGEKRSVETEAYRRMWQAFVGPN